MSRFSFRNPAWLFFWFPPLTGLYAVNHTAALCTLLLLIGISHIFWMARNKENIQVLLPAKLEQSAFLALTLWLIFHSIFIASNSSAALSSLASNWLKLMLVIFLGIWISKVIDNRRHISLSLFFGAFLHVILTLLAQLISIIKGHGITYHQSLLALYPIASTYSLAALSWILADLIFRLQNKDAIFPWSKTISVIFGLSAILSLAVLKAKSGQLVVFMLFLVAGVSLLLTWRFRQVIITLLFAALALIIALGFTAGKNPWSGNIPKTIELVAKHPAVLPLLASDIGAPVPEGANPSIYIRAVRAKVAIEGIYKHPLGLGFESNVFRHFVEENYGVRGNDSSNSGLLDFTLATGIPGLLFFLLLIFALIWKGWTVSRNGNWAGLMLVFATLVHIGVYTLDGTLTGSRFTLIGLILGILWGLSNLVEHQSKK